MEWLIKKMLKSRLGFISGWVILAIASLSIIDQLHFSFELEQLFPQGDEELEFYKNFAQDFKKDDGFLFIALEAKDSIFDSTYLADVHRFVQKAKKWQDVEAVYALTTMSYPVKTPFGLTTIPYLHRDNPSQYQSDKKAILNNPKLHGQYITKDTNALIVRLLLKDNFGLEQSVRLMQTVEQYIAEIPLKGAYYLGRPYFQREMVALQKNELKKTTIISGTLISAIIFLLFRRVGGLIVVILSVAVGFIIFLGFLALFGRELHILSALYPLLMVIVGTSDVIHITTKYVDELRKGFSRHQAASTALRQIGLATLFTSLTTAIGYFSLVTSRIYPIQDFGINSAIGVMIAYIVVISFTVPILTIIPQHRLIKTDRYQQKWTDLLDKLYHFTIQRDSIIIRCTLFFILLASVGIYKINTNFLLENNLPRHHKIALDYKYFEKNLAGFKPIQIAISTDDDRPINQMEILQQVDRLEKYLSTIPAVITSYSINDMYRTLNRAYHSNKKEYYRFPEDKKSFELYKRQLSKYNNPAQGILINRSKNKLRLTVYFRDIGSEGLIELGEQIDQWIEQNILLEGLHFRQTGSGYLLDRNSRYVVRGLFYGLILAIAIVSFLMMLLFRDPRLIIISLVPNIIPLLFTAAALGYLGIELEAGISIIFAITFGIAVDDSIHFLSKFKISFDRTQNVEQSIRVTFLETGKAIVITTILLFFGFMVLLFSEHPPSFAIGILLSFSLVSALVADLMLLPILLRRFFRAP